MDQVLSTLRDHGVTLNLDKCRWFSDSVNYLGHVIRPGTLEIDELATRALREMSVPTTQTELRSFLGMCNVYRRFVRNYTDIAAPLNARLRKGQPVQLEPFGEIEMEAFDTLKEAICSPPILALPKPGLPYSVDTDASELQVGAALFQTHEEGRKPIGFWSRTLHQAERNYSTPEKECLAVIWAVTTLRPYLQGVHFTVHTDHSSLRWLMEITDASGRLMRWRLRLGEFDFTVKYKKGLLNTQADALSRLPSTGSTTAPLDEEIPCFLSGILEDEWEEENSQALLEFEFAEVDALLATQTYSRDEDLIQPITREELLREQLTDPFCADIRRQLNEGGAVSFCENDQGVLVRTGNRYDQIVVPKTLRPRVL